MKTEKIRRISNFKVEKIVKDRSGLFQKVFIYAVVDIHVGTLFHPRIIRATIKHDYSWSFVDENIAKRFGCEYIFDMLMMPAISEYCTLEGIHNLEKADVPVEIIQARRVDPPIGDSLDAVFGAGIRNVKRKTSNYISYIDNKIFNSL